MSGGIAVKDGSRGGGSPELHKRSAETRGDPGWSRRESLTAWGPQAPNSKTVFVLSGAKSPSRVRDAQGAMPCSELRSMHRAKAEPGEARPEGERPPTHRLPSENEHATCNRIRCPTFLWIGKRRAIYRVTPLSTCGSNAAQRCVGCGAGVVD